MMSGAPCAALIYRNPKCMLRLGLENQDRRRLNRHRNSTDNISKKVLSYLSGRRSMIRGTK